MKTHTGFVAIVGRPNVGKSTLLNEILGQKVAIVSHRPQTTRNRILGVKTTGTTQLIFFDTPGIHKRRANMSRFMVKEAFDSFDNLDALVLVIEIAPRPARLGEDDLPRSAQLNAGDAYVLEQVQQHCADTPVILVLNKVDQVKDRTLVLPLIESWHERGFETIIPISALRGDGIDNLMGELLRRMPEGEHIYPADMFTDRAERFLVGELIREQVFLMARQEVPFGTAVEVERFDERSAKGDVFIEATIVVEREGHKAILVGHRGERIKDLGIKSRAEISKLLGCNNHLKLTVRVAKEWTRHPGLRRRFGYE